MKRSFIDRRYSPSTGMSLNEWEVILDELIRMGYIVKDNPIVIIMNESFALCCCHKVMPWCVFALQYCLLF
jgi:hypothetical protein